VPQGRGNARDDWVPVSRFILPKQPGRRVPGTVVTIEQPSPTGIVAIDQPDRLTERAGEVRYGSVDGNDQIQILDERGGIGKVLEIG
jgi:hypothetical protein